MNKKLNKPLTKSGFEKISEEYHSLLGHDRPQMAENMATAAAEGDRSENAEYIYSRKRLREIDKRLRYLSSLLKDADIIDPNTIMSDRICFGATVTLKDEEENLKKWTLVGMGEADVKEKTISYKSPLARAITNKQVGDWVTVHTPSGEIDYEIVDLEFAGRPWRKS